jgi:hypothetical protein
LAFTEPVVPNLQVKDSPTPSSSLSPKCVILFVFLELLTSLVATLQRVNVLAKLDMDPQMLLLIASRCCVPKCATMVECAQMVCVFALLDGLGRIAHKLICLRIVPKETIQTQFPWRITYLAATTEFAQLILDCVIAIKLLDYLGKFLIVAQEIVPEFPNVLDMVFAKLPLEHAIATLDTRDPDARIK